MTRGYLNLCRACGEDFSGIKTFDRHRVGKHEYTFSPEHLDGRRCLDTEELGALGWERNEGGRWHDPIQTARARLLRPAQLTEAA